MLLGNDLYVFDIKSMKTVFDHYTSILKLRRHSLRTLWDYNLTKQTLIRYPPSNIPNDTCVM